MSQIIHEVKDFPIVFSQNKNDELNARIEAFVLAMKRKKQSVDYYVENRNVEASKAAEDIFLGKKAEYIALAALVKYFNYPTLDIDLEIREGSSKGWDKDLQFNRIDSNFPNVHVKACSSHTYRICDNDYSWTFQKSNNNGKFGSDDVLNEMSNDLVAMVYLDNPKSNKGIVKAIIQQKSIFQYLKLPKKVSLWGLKRCIYYDDLK